MRVAILGCGYVGCALARQCVDAGHQVIGVRRSSAECSAIEATGATAICGDVREATTFDVLSDVDWVVFAASAGGGANKARRTLIDGLDLAFESFGGRDNPPARLLYTSSTGVYGDHQGEWVDETTPIEPAGAKETVLADAEELVIRRGEATGIEPIVARLSGVYGPGRYRLERYLEQPVTPGWRNSIHRDDAAGAIHYLLSRGSGTQSVVLVTDDQPIDRYEFAVWLANEIGVEPPATRSPAEVLDDPQASQRAKRRLLTQKRCSNAYLRALGYDLEYPTVREGYREALAAYEG